LNTKAIAEVAGVLVRSVYGYFPNKEATVDRILEQH
jgi:AcrR family transcriptional regulator